MEGDGGRQGEHHLGADVARKHVRGEEGRQWLWACVVLLDSAVISILVRATEAVVHELIVLHLMVTKASRASRGALRCECTEEALISPRASALLLNRLASQDESKVPTLESAEVPTACSMGCPIPQCDGLAVAVRLVVAHGVRTAYATALGW